MDFEEKILDLLPSSLRQENGIGPGIDLGKHRGQLLQVTLVISNVMENEGLIVSIWGSIDQSDFGVRPILSFSPKFYCGVYTTFLDLTKYPNLRYLRAVWTMNRRGAQHRPPMFGFHISAQESRLGIARAVA